MRSAAFWLLALAALAVAEYEEEQWVEHEDVDDPYEEEVKEEPYSRRRREAYVENPYEEHVRVKRKCNDEPEYRVRRSADNVRVPRQVHQYEVREFTDDFAPSSPPYEQMLAASAEHYQRVYVAPPPAAARYLNQDVSGSASVASPVQFVAPPKHPKAVSYVAPPNAVNVPSLTVANPVPLKQLAAGDLLSAASHHDEYEHSHHQGGAHDHHGDHHATHGGKVRSPMQNNSL
jgi:hypothetical protein